MADPVAWPVGVPQEAEREGWAMDAPQQEVLVTEFEDGAERFRLRGSTVRSTLTESLIMTAAEVQLFEQWFLNQCSRGTAQFNKTVWTPTGSQVRRCQFVNATYALASNGAAFTVTYQIRVYNR